MKKTCLYDEHIALGAQMVSFEGWQMPIRYESAIKEHDWVRENVGIFDISHMAKINVRGKRAEEYLNYLAVNDVSKLQDKQAQYAVFCHEDGGSVDDVLIYRESQDAFFVVVNASNRDKDLNHLLKFAEAYNVTLSDEFEKRGILAIQGPKSKELLSSFWKEIDSLSYMHFIQAHFDKQEITIARSGYTGEVGYEIYGPDQVIKALWNTFLKESTTLKPIGLAARDILRLEMGYALYGHELSDEISPVESVASWVVKFKKPSFLGKEALIKIKEDLNKRSSYGIILAENAIARKGCEVLINQDLRGVVTSGIYSPSLKRSIALILVEGALKETDKIKVSLRGREIEAEKVTLPFLKK